MFEFDWERPEELLRRAPRLRWVQATSSGIGPQVDRLGLAGAPLVITNAAGIHAAGRVRRPGRAVLREGDAAAVCVEERAALGPVLRARAVRVADDADRPRAGQRQD